MNLTLSISSGISKVQREQWYIIVIFLIAVVLRLPHLLRGIEAGDQVQIYFAQNDLPYIIHNIREFGPYGPLNFILMHFWFVLSESNAWTRLYFLLLGTGTCFLVYLIGKEHVDKRFGLLAFFLTACSPFMIWASGYTKYYMESTFFVLLSTFLFMKILEGERKVPIFVGYVVASVASIYSAYFCIVILVAQNLFVLAFVKRYKAILQSWLTAQCVIGLSFIPWVPVLLYQVGNTSDKGRSELWEHVGFQVLGIKLGVIIRNLAAIAGLDPYLGTQAIASILDRKLLITISCTALALFLIVFSLGLNYLKQHVLSEKISYLLFPFLVTVVFGITLIAWKVFDFQPIPRYQLISHTFFVFILAGALSCLVKMRKGYLSVLLFTLVALIRLPALYSAEIQIRECMDYINLQTEPEPSKHVLISLGVSSSLVHSGVMIIQLKEGDFKRDKRTGRFLALKDETCIEIINRINSHPNIFFVFHGLHRPFDLEGPVRQLLVQHDYLAKNHNQFRGVGLIEFSKRSTLPSGSGWVREISEQESP